MKVSLGDVVKVSYKNCPHLHQDYCFMGLVVEVTYYDFFSVMTIEEKIRIVNPKEDRVEIIFSQTEQRNK